MVPRIPGARPGAIRRRIRPAAPDRVRRRAKAGRSACAGAGGALGCAFESAGCVFGPAVGGGATSKRAPRARPLRKRAPGARTTRAQRTTRCSLDSHGAHVPGPTSTSASPRIPDRLMRLRTLQSWGSGRAPNRARYRPRECRTTQASKRAFRGALPESVSFKMQRRRARDSRRIPRSGRNQSVQWPRRRVRSGALFGGRYRPPRGARSAD